MSQRSFPSKKDRLISFTQENTIDQYIGRRIQAVRKSKNMSQKALLQLLPTHLTQQRLSQFEQGVSSIPANLLFDISLALGVTTETFMPLSSSPVNTTSLPAVTLTNAIEAAVASFSLATGVSPEEIRQLEKMLKHFYKD